MLANLQKFCLDFEISLSSLLSSVFLLPQPALPKGKNF
jgi:hypothetical protein